MHRTSKVIASATAFAAMAVTFALAAPAANMKAYMTDTVGPATQPIWDFGYADKVTDADWRNIQQSAAKLVASVNTVASGGSVPAEQARAKEAMWQDWSKKLRDGSAAAKVAADKKDQMALQTTGDALLEICAGCHMAYDPTSR